MPRIEPSTKPSIPETPREVKEPPENQYPDYDDVSRFLASLRESQKGNLYSTWHGERVLLSACQLCIFKKGRGWSWLIANDDATLFSKHEFADEHEAARSLLEALDRDSLLKSLDDEEGV